MIRLTAQNPATRPRADSGPTIDWTGPAVAVLLFTGFLVIRLPFLSAYPVNWDSVQYLLGVQSFDLERHQPHPPGYIGYILLGRLFGTLLGDPHRGLVALSALSGATATVSMIGLARCWLDRRFAIITAILFGTSPLVWYYSEVALNYIVEAALVIPLAWLCYRARKDRNINDLLLAGALLAMLGAIRQSGMVLLAPLWLYTVLAFPWRQRFLSIGAVSVLTLAWLLPLLWLAGGPINYWNESRALGALVTENSSLLASLRERFGYLMILAVAVLSSLAAGLALLVAYRSTAASIINGLPAHDRWFFALWAAPSLATYLLGHMGQPGYILTILPIGFLWIGALLSKLPRPDHSYAYTPALLLAATVLVANSLMFSLAPTGTLTLARTVGGGDASAPALHLRQYDVPASDGHWRELVRDIEGFPSESTAVLTTIGGPRISGSFRHLSYYLPEYRVYGLGRDQFGGFGHLFTALDGENDYSVRGLRTAQRVVEFPEDIRYFLTPDPEIIEQIPKSMHPAVVADSGLVLFRRSSDANLAFLPEDEVVFCECSPLAPNSEIFVADGPDPRAISHVSTPAQAW